MTTPNTSTTHADNEIGKQIEYLATNRLDPDHLEHALRPLGRGLRRRHRRRSYLTIRTYFPQRL